MVTKPLLLLADFPHSFISVFKECFEPNILLGGEGMETNREGLAPTKARHLRSDSK